MGLVHPRLQPSPYRINFIGGRHGRSPPSEPTGEGNFPNNGLRAKKGSHRNDAGEILLITAGVQQASESSERNTGQPQKLSLAKIHPGGVDRESSYRRSSRNGRPRAARQPTNDELSLDPRIPSFRNPLPHH